MTKVTKMEIIFVSRDCIVDGCYKKNMGKGKRMCKIHQAEYEEGKMMKVLYGKTVQKVKNEIINNKIV